MEETPKEAPTKSTLLDELAGLELAAELEYEELVGRFADRVAAYERVASLAEQLGISIKPLPFRLANGAEEEPPEPPQTPPEAAQRPPDPKPVPTPSPRQETVPRPPQAVAGIDGDVILALSDAYPRGLNSMALGQLFKGRTEQMHEALTRLKKSGVVEEGTVRSGKRMLVSYRLSSKEA